MATLTHLHSNPYIYVCLVPLCNSIPMTATGAPPPEVPSVAGNTQADDTLPSIGARGGANYGITLGPQTQLFGGARAPPPPFHPGKSPTQTPPPQIAPTRTPPPPAQGGLRLMVRGGVSWHPDLRSLPLPPWPTPTPHQQQQQRQQQH